MDSSDPLTDCTMEQYETLKMPEILSGVKAILNYDNSNICSNITRLYLLVSCAREGILDRMRWVSTLLAAEAPLAGGIA